MLVRPIGSRRSYEEDVNARKKFSAKFLINHNKRLGSYVLRYFVFNWGNLLSSYVMFFICDWFLNGNFWKYGTGMFSQNNELVLNVFDRTFPLQASCTASYSGPSGETQKEDLICILQLNSLNRIIFLVFWYARIASLPFKKC
jgi:hypothetical protein